MFCTYRKRTNHNIGKCYKLHGYPSDYKFTKNKQGTTSCVQTRGAPSAIGTSLHHGKPFDILSAFTQEQSQQILHLFNQTHLRLKFQLVMTLLLPALQVCFVLLSLVLIFMFVVYHNYIPTVGS